MVLWREIAWNINEALEGAISIQWYAHALKLFRRHPGDNFSPVVAFLLSWMHDQCEYSHELSATLPCSTSVSQELISVFLKVPYSQEILPCDHFRVANSSGMPNVHMPCAAVRKRISTRHVLGVHVEQVVHHCIPKILLNVDLNSIEQIIPILIKGREFFHGRSILIRTWPRTTWYCSCRNYPPSRGPLAGVPRCTTPGSLLLPLPRGISAPGSSREL